MSSIKTAKSILASKTLNLVGERILRKCLLKVQMTHRRYYQEENGYDRLMRPTISTADQKEKLKLWKQNIESKAVRANRIALKNI